MLLIFVFLAFLKFIVKRFISFIPANPYSVPYVRCDGAIRLVYMCAGIKSALRSEFLKVVKIYS